MGWNGAGGYNRTHNFSADASAQIKILAARVDAEFNDFASAMTLAVARDGQNTPTANLPMGGFRHTNVGAPTSASNYIRTRDVIENIPIYMVDAEASADRISVSAVYFTTASAATAPRDGTHVLIKAGSDKSSAVAIRLNTGDGNPHSANVVLANGSAIFSGAIRSGGIYEFFWSSSDGAWQLFNPQVDYASSAFPGVIMLATSAEVAAGTDVPKAVTPSQMADKFSADYATTASAGLVELATTAEGLSGTNVSVAITPAVLDAVISTTFDPYLSASVGGPGVIEIATTAEGSAGTDATRAVTPAVLGAVINPHIPYLMVLTWNSASGEPIVVSKNTQASAWTFTTGSALGGSWKVTHNLGLASAHGLNINIQILSPQQPLLEVQFTSIGTSAFAFTLASTSVSVFSAVVHMQAFRMT